MTRPLLHAPHLSEPIKVRESLDLAATTAAVAVARLFVRTTLQAWGAECIAEDAELVSSELVSNALEACSPASGKNQCRAMSVNNLIRLRLLGMPHTMALEVWDRCPGKPRLQKAPALAESGRGLEVVDELSLRWGFYPIRPQPGKIVWSELAVPATSVVTA
jgi:anti-sigma regulatory factor (Ser/Thr protein kinase)